MCCAFTVPCPSGSQRKQGRSVEDLEEEIRLSNMTDHILDMMHGNEDDTRESLRSYLDSSTVSVANKVYAYGTKDYSLAMGREPVHVHQNNVSDRQSDTSTRSDPGDNHKAQNSPKNGEPEASQGIPRLESSRCCEVVS